MENNASAMSLCSLNDYTYSSDERPASGSDLIKTKTMSELTVDENSFCENNEKEKDMLEQDVIRQTKFDKLETVINDASSECNEIAVQKNAMSEPLEEVPNQTCHKLSLIHISEPTRPY